VADRVQSNEVTIEYCPTVKWSVISLRNHYRAANSGYSGTLFWTVTEPRWCDITNVKHTTGVCWEMTTNNNDCWVSSLSSVLRELMCSTHCFYGETGNLLTSNHNFVKIWFTG
jgi:hypothetical protein